MVSLLLLETWMCCNWVCQYNKNIHVDVERTRWIIKKERTVDKKSIYHGYLPPRSRFSTVKKYFEFAFSTTLPLSSFVWNCLGSDQYACNFHYRITCCSHKSTNWAGKFRGWTVWAAGMRGRFKWEWIEEDLKKRNVLQYLHYTTYTHTGRARKRRYWVYCEDCA